MLCCHIYFIHTAGITVLSWEHTQVHNPSTVTMCQQQLLVPVHTTSLSRHAAWVAREERAVTMPPPPIFVLYQTACLSILGEYIARWGLQSLLRQGPHPHILSKGMWGMCEDLWESEGAFIIRYPIYPQRFQLISGGRETIGEHLFHTAALLTCWL